MKYIYDGSFEGYLTAIYEAYYRRETPERILPDTNLQESLFEENIRIETNSSKASRVANSINEKISPTSLENVYYTFLSELDESDVWIFQYIKLGFKVGKNIDSYLSDDRVLKIMKINRKVTREIHRMLGLIRFRQLEGNIFYAPIEPDFNIITLIAPHFQKRFADQNWVIHDIKRNLAVLFDCINMVLAPLTPDFAIELSKKETDYQHLWIQYFKSIAIKNRINPKLQKQFMPHRYWKYLIEK
ncbi:MAG: TIGR03915 family putative DNA repair protein [Clostridia bacterium]|nr:TIGR03915 family putative DNA repair protein [Clostridia bacterium]